MGIMRKREEGWYLRITSMDSAKPKETPWVREKRSGTGKLSAQASRSSQGALKEQESSWRAPFAQASVAARMGH